MAIFDGHDILPTKPRRWISLQTHWFCMGLHSNSIETSTHDLLRTILIDGPEEVLVIRPGKEVTEALSEVLGKMENPPQIRLLGWESVLKDIRRNFRIASGVADLLEDGALSLRATDENPANSLVITDESVVSLVSTSTQIAGLVTDDSEFVESAREYWQSVWESSEKFGLRTPGRSQVENTLSEEFGPEEVADFRTMIDALATARGTDDGDGNERGGGLSEVGVSLLMAAKHGELLYDISTWGEDVGVASRATFSRAKTQLEEQGLITTEKVPIDVGRPRLRLRLGNEELREADTTELVSAAHGKLSRTA